MVHYKYKVEKYLPVHCFGGYELSYTVLFYVLLTFILVFLISLHILSCRPLSSYYITNSCHLIFLASKDYLPCLHQTAFSILNPFPIMLKSSFDKNPFRSSGEVGIYSNIRLHPTPSYPPRECYQIADGDQVISGDKVGSARLTTHKHAGQH